MAAAVEEAEVELAEAELEEYCSARRQYVEVARPSVVLNGNLYWVVQVLGLLVWKANCLRNCFLVRHLLQMLRVFLVTLGVPVTKKIK